MLGVSDLESMLSRAMTQQRRAAEAERARQAQEAQQAEAGAQAAQGTEAQDGQGCTCRAPVDPQTQQGARQVAAGTEDQQRTRLEQTPDAAAVGPRASRGLSAADEPASSRTLRRGDRGDEVRELQEGLNRQGAGLQVDGVFGPKTQRAVRELQQRNGLREDGIVGAQTRGALAGATRPSGATGASGATGPSGTTAPGSIPAAPGSDPTQPARKISGGPDRSQFDAELKNPAVRQRMQALAVAEVGKHPEAQRALMETIFNRAQATGKTLMQTMNSRYYEPMQRGGAAFARAEREVQNNPALQRQLDDVMRDVRAGSNVSNYATDNSSAGVARAAERSQVITARIGGETFSRKEGRRNGVSHADYRPWLQNHPRNP